MHVRHVVRQFHPLVGGLEDAVANLATSLAAMPGVETSVVTLDRGFRDRAVRMPARGALAGVPIVRIPFTGSTRYPVAPKILSELGGADIVHVHGIDFFFDFLALTRPWHRKPLVASTHGGFFHTDFAGRAKRAYFQSVTRLSATAYARIFGSSENDARMFAAIAPSKTIAIENGVNIVKFAGRAAAEPTRTMIFIGRFSSNKAIPKLFPVVQALNAAGPTWRLIVAGSESDLTAADLMNKAQAAGVADSVEIATGLSDAAIGDLIARASYIVSASDYEGFGLSAIEGMSAGLTPLLSRIPPFDLLVARSGRGMTLDFDDAPSAAARIIALHDAQRGDFAHRRALNIAATAAYGWPGVARRFHDEYRAVLGQE